MRDPRLDPCPGDVVRDGFGQTEVTSVLHDGTYVVWADDRGMRGGFTVEAWRRCYWDAVVVRTAGRA